MEGIAKKSLRLINLKVMFIQKKISWFILSLCLLNCQLQKPYSPIIIKEVFLVISKNNEIAINRDIEATVNDKIIIYPVVKAKVGEEIIYFSEADSIKINGERVRPQKYSPKFGPLNLKLYEIHPVFKIYKQGEEIKFIKKEIGRKWRLRLKKPGTKRFKAEVSNIASQEIRVSLRENKGDFVDYTTLFFNTAYIYGSTKDQVENFIGVDCQDLVIYALKRAGIRNLSYDTHIHNVYKNKIIFEGYIGRFGKIYNKEGKPTELKIKRGDIIRFVNLWEGRGHYAVIYKDNSFFGFPNGKLDLFDDLIHSLVSTHVIKLFNLLRSKLISKGRVDIQVFRFF